MSRIISDIDRKYIETLNESFNEDNFYEFINDLLNLDNNDINIGSPKSTTLLQYKNYIDYSKYYAEYDINYEKIGVLTLKVNDNKNVQNARTLQRNYIAHLMDEYGWQGCVAGIYSDTDTLWRLSFVKKEQEIVYGKLKEKKSPAKRYSYLFGKNEPNHTAQTQLLSLLTDKTEKFTIEEIERVFDVEKVTKEFFNNYKDNYLLLKENIENNEEFLSESKRCGFTSEEFAKKLMGQIVFIYFLQKKGWLGVGLVPKKLSFQEYDNIYAKSDVLQKKILEKYYTNFNNNKKIIDEYLKKYDENMQEIESLSNIFRGTNYDRKWGTGDKQFIRTIFNNCDNNNRNFFDDYLEPFFYDGLNHKRKNQYFSLFNCKIPFLNGGLFEPLDNYQWKIARFNISNSIFSNQEGTGVLDFFDRYNFTIDEEEPLEVDVAVDPEMLGKIFEELLDVKDRKSTGSFYTPREIVHYMCQESLANFLVNKVGVDYNEIKDFIQYGELIKDIDLKEASKDSHLLGDSVFDNILQIDEALEKVKIADPAVGSGAFPVGMLNEIVKLRYNITSYMLIYNRLRKFDKIYSEERITSNKRSIYNLKWNAIKNNIYAVDIENSAVDITKLRLWLSIIVDQNDVPMSGPEPLPNLDFKIMQGNSLIDEYKGIKLIDERFIEELKDRTNVRLNNGGKEKEKNRLVPILGTQIEFGDGLKRAQIDDLINLKQELYGVKDPERKKELMNTIKERRKEIIRLNFAGTEKEKELSKIDKSHNKPYFAWLLEFIEVFITNNGFDIVIGNPPYVSTKGTSEIDKKNLENVYGFSDDLYYHFIIFGLKILKEHGINTMITPDTYFTTLTKKDLRKSILNNKLIQLVDLGYDIFDSALVSTAISVIEKSDKYNNDENTTVVIDVKGKKSILQGENYKIKQSEYKTSINQAFYIPDILNKQINEKLYINHFNLIEKYWNMINTSRNIEKNKEIIYKYRNGLKPGDWTIVGLVTEGGQGLATSNNGRFLGIKKGTKEAQRALIARKEKLEALNENMKTNYKMPENEYEVWNLFECLKEKYGRDVFGQGFVYKIIDNDLIADVKNLDNYSKVNGIENEKCFVPYDKGDKDGNRWYFETPFYICWSRDNVKFLKMNSGKKGKGMPVVRNSQFYFREGFCYMDVNTYYLKCRKKGISVHDVMGMSFFTCMDAIPEYYLICIINSEIIARLVFNFLNNTSHFQINDCRMLPIPVPNSEQLKKSEELYKAAELVQKQYFGNIISKEEKEQKLSIVQKEVDEFVLKLYGLE